MRGASRESLAAVRDRLEPVLPTLDPLALGEQLFAVAALLDSSRGLRDALADSSRDADSRVELARRLLTGRLAGSTVEVVTGAVRERWAHPSDLPDALERLGVEAVLASAERDGALDRVEDELFRFARIVDGDNALHRALDDRGAAHERGDLVDRLLARKVVPATLVLVRQVVVAPRDRRVEEALAGLLDAAAARRSRRVAVVTAAVPLSEAQRERLTRSLGRVYGSAVLLEVQVDPEVVGGLRVEVGSEVIDATTASRLAEVRRRMAR